ncbi:MAG: UDP-N-acetylmuramoyl-L-alanyl-D-glutamate--2,6-diaminopimelate ligase [Epsilonproteobacteria bacterium]|nr:UDP-N-acetylmuramoyl-L-alanyl-D-glutamate--2,6-diaminopimelate ligase [Campylobacterota bacterium]
MQNCKNYLKKQKIVTITDDNFTVTDNTNECVEGCYFLVTDQNRKYLDNLDKNKIARFVDSKELQTLLGLDGLKFVGITGTNGKTTTAAAIYSMLLDLGENVALQGTRGFFINEEKIEGKSLTTPSLLATLHHAYTAKKRGCRYFVMEVSSHAIVQNRIDGLEFYLKVFTNISRDHLDYHKTMDEYKRVKSSFFQDDAKKLINKDGGKIDFNVKNALTYSIEYPATYKIDAYSLDNGISAVLRHFNELVEFHSPMVGLFNLYNITAAIASVDMITDKSLKEIAKTAENFAGVKGRMQVVSVEPLVIVDFAHTPDGMSKVLDSIKDKDISVVFGAGGDRDRGKRALMGRVASRFAKKIYITSDNPRGEEPMQIIKDIAEGVDEGANALIIPDRKKAIKIALENMDKDEVLFVLGKGDEEYQEIKGERLPFSDEDTIRALV